MSTKGQIGEEEVQVCGGGSRSGGQDVSQISKHSDQIQGRKKIMNVMGCNSCSFENPEEEIHETAVRFSFPFVEVEYKKGEKYHQLSLYKWLSPTKLKQLVYTLQ